MEKKINVGLIGAGRIAGHHIRSILRFKKFKIISIADLNQSKSTFYAKKYKIRSYGHYSEMFKREKLDLAVIMTPSGMHYAHARDIIKKYKVSCVIEKPPCMKPSQAKELFKLAKKYNLKVFPIFQNRYNKAIKFVKNELRKGNLGKIITANLNLRWCRPQRYYDLSIWRGTFSHDGGAFTNQGIHYIDLLRYLVGEVSDVFCTMKTYGAKIEVEDTGVAIVKFQNGSIGNVEITTAARPNDFGAYITLVASKGIVKIGGLAANKLEYYSINNKLCKKYSEKVPDAYGYGHIETYKSILECFVRKKKEPISNEDCLKTLKLLNLFYLSNEKGKEKNIKTSEESRFLGRSNNKISKKYL